MPVIRLSTPDNIRAERSRRRLSQADLADLSGLSQYQVMKAEVSEITKPEIVQRIASVLGVTADSLLEVTEWTEPTKSISGGVESTPQSAKA